MSRPYPSVVGRSTSKDNFVATSRVRADHMWIDLTGQARSPAWAVGEGLERRSSHCAWAEFLGERVLS